MSSRGRKRLTLYLIGFMGAGKTTVGQSLAKRLGLRFVDTDQLIERQSGQTVAALFAERGERYFRALERKVVEQVSRQGKQVVAVGGGAVMDDENWQRMQQTGVTVYLKCSPTVLERRLDADTSRPLLQVGAGERRADAIRGLLALREPRYMRAQVVIGVQDDTTVEELVEQLVEVFHRHYGGV
ncbi:MAG: shikimate kinase [candidate division KSB1 bacterium]|nr:shikimate kinase [candidate division KSB1 bacterium]